jgi:predicted tellurium resistance membrane protein TerC
MNSLFTVENAISLLSLSAMEIVLGIDNIVFIAILSQKLPPEQQGRARKLGIGLALVLRLALLFTLSTIMRLTEPLFGLFGHEISGRDLVLLGGGLFLVGKSTTEIYDKVEGDELHGLPKSGRNASFAATLVQILILDVVFSLDSVITAVGMAPHMSIMVVAMIAAVLVMLIFADSVSTFIGRHPSMKILALSFLLLIGVLLIAEGFGKSISKGYIYFAMAFALLIELLNMRMRGRTKVPSRKS